MIIKKNGIELMLHEKLENCDEFIKNPIIIFKISNFLDENSYKNLVEEIYSISEFNKPFTGKGEKAINTINGSNINKIKNSTLKNFCKIILSKNFYLWFKQTHLLYYDKKNFQIYIQTYQNFFWRVFNKINKYLKFPLTIYYTEIEYSSIKMGGFIPPHTDNKNKRLSLVYYLPKKNYELNEAMKKNLGTVFWRAQSTAVAPIKRFDCGLLDGEERDDFYASYEPLHIFKYEPNQIVGFIKSDISWHSVEKFEFDYDRRAIVINIYELGS
jgi:hypothetical protein